MDNVSSFAPIIFHPSTLILFLIVDVLEDDRRVRSQLGSRGGYPNHAHAVRWSGFRSLGQYWVQKFCEEEMPNVICSQLKFISLSCFRTLWRRHNACIQPQDIEPLFFALELFCRFLDGGEVGEVEVEEHELAFGVGVASFDPIDGFGCFLLRAHGDVYFGVVLIEDRGKLFSDTRGGPGDDEDLTWY